MGTDLLMVLLVMNMAVLGLVAWLMRRERRVEIDLEQVADALTRDLLRDWGDDVVTLDQVGVEQWARTRYMQLVAEYGFPAQAATTVGQLVWERVHRAQGKPPTKPVGFAFYE